MEVDGAGSFFFSASYFAFCSAARALKKSFRFVSILSFFGEAFIGDSGFLGLSDVGLDVEGPATWMSTLLSKLSLVDLAFTGLGFCWTFWIFFGGDFAGFKDFIMSNCSLRISFTK